MGKKLNRHQPNKITADVGKISTKNIPVTRGTKKRNEPIVQTEYSQVSIDDNNSGDDNEISEAFFQSVRNKKKINDKNIKKTNDIPFNKTSKDISTSSYDSEGFVVVQKVKKSKQKQEILKTPQGYGNEGLNLAMQNDKFLAAEYFSHAIDLDCHDYRHFFNRSYCYLGTNQYRPALDDCNKILNRSCDPEHVGKIKCRQGQIYAALGDYFEAEKCFHDSLRACNNSIAVKCEMFRAKVVQLTNMGFSERNVMTILNRDPTMNIENAVNYLTPVSDISNISSGASDTSSSSSDLDNEIYYSDEENYPSCMKMFMDAVRFQNYKDETLWKCTGSANCNVNLSLSSNKFSGSVPDLKVAHASAKKKSPPVAPDINTRAVWVGSVTRNISDAMIKMAFLKFGNVTSVHRMPGGTCAFVNFSEPQSVQKALQFKTIEIVGQLLPIRHNIRNT